MEVTFLRVLCHHHHSQLLYAEGFSDGDESLAQDVLEKVWSLDPRSQPRMIDYTDAHYYRVKMRRREVCSVFCLGYFCIDCSQAMLQTIQHNTTQQTNYACRVVCGSTNKNLARNVSRCLGHKSLCGVNVGTHANGECNMQILDNVCYFTTLPL